MHSSSGTTTTTSPGWETVVSSKSVKGAGGNKNKQSAANAARKKFVEKAPRLEDVLPMDQVNAIYNAEPTMRPLPPSPGKVNPPKAATVNKKSKKSAKSDHLSSAQSKPKTFEMAVKQFGVNEFKSALQETRTFYGSNHAMWIKEAAVYLNEWLATEQPAIDFSDHFTSQPMSLVTREMKKVVVQLLEECGDAGRQAGYESLVANVGHDLSKSQQSNVNGYLVVIQILAESYPHLALLNNKRCSELINSYQNRATVCIPVLWALGQSGRKDLAVGLKVWIEFMKPLLRYKNYSRHVVTYLTNIWSEHQINPSQRLLYAPQFFAIFDAMFTDASSLSKDLQSNLTSVYPNVKTVTIGDCSLDHELFPEFLRRISDWHLLPAPRSEEYCKTLMDCIVDCLTNNPLAVISHWQQMYRAHFYSSAFVLQQLGSKACTPRLNGSKQLRLHSESFQDLVEAFQEYNSTCSSSKEGIKLANEGCKNLLITTKKMTAGSGGSGGLPYKTMIILLAVGLGLVVNYDVSKKGSFKASNTGMFLQDIGMFERTVNTYNYSMESYHSTKAWAQVNLPVYYKQAKAQVGPAVDKAVIHAKWTWGETKKIGTIIVDKANEYLPGAKEKTHLFMTEVTRLSKISFNWLVVNGRVLMVNLSHGAQSAAKSIQITVKDIIDGKFELKDVYNGALNLGDKALDRFEEFRKSVSSK